MYNKIQLKKENVLILSPHPDDEVIGCGGVLLELARLNANVYTLYLNRAEESRFLRDLDLNKKIRTRESEIRKVACLLKWIKFDFVYDKGAKPNENVIMDRIEKFIELSNPSKIFIPWYGDNHVEHKIFNSYLAKSRLTMNFLKNSQICAYEVWSPITAPTSFFEVTSLIDKKAELISLYSSVTQEVNYIDTTLGLNRYRSLYSNSGKGYFEVFLNMPLKDYIYLLEKSL